MVGKCISAEKHPKADKLNIYLFECDDGLTRQIVANHTNIYSLEDKVNLVLPGESYENMEISERKVMGELSQGMAIGLVK